MIERQTGGQEGKKIVRKTDRRTERTRHNQKDRLMDLKDKRQSVRQTDE